VLKEGGALFLEDVGRQIADSGVWAHHESW
jgi:hypothetical protein